jgi:hypothetical protein
LEATGLQRLELRTQEQRRQLGKIELQANGSCRGLDSRPGQIAEDGIRLEQQLAGRNRRLVTATK